MVPNWEPVLWVAPCVGGDSLMCHTCNAIKGNRDMGYLKQQLQVRGILRG